MADPQPQTVIVPIPPPQPPAASAMSLAPAGAASGAGAMGFAPPPVAPPQPPAAPAADPNAVASSEVSAPVVPGAMRETYGKPAPTEMPPDLESKILAREGSGDDSVSPAGAIGKHQIMPETAAGYGVSRDQLFDPKINAQLGHKIIADLWAKYHDPTAVMVAYNAGPGRADQWLAAGKDPSVLPQETQRYIGAVPPLRTWANSISPETQAEADSLKAESNRMRDEYHREADELIRQANEKPAGSAERDAVIAELRQKEHEYTQKYEQIASTPPAMKPVDMMNNFGNAATIIALLGGLFARQHLTTALGAAGEAMQAINQNNWDQFQQKYKVWEQQSTTALNMVKLQNEEIRELIDDKKMATDDKNTRLQTLFQAMGMNRQADMMALGTHEKVFAEQIGLEKALHSAAQSQLEFKKQMVTMMMVNDPTLSLEDASRRAGLIPQGRGSDKPQNIQATDKDGKQIYTGLATFDPATKTYTPIGWDHPLPSDVTVAQKTPSAGAQAATQINTLVGATVEIAPALKNLADLDIGITPSVFMGVQNQTPDTLAEAVKRSLVNDVTSDQASAISTRFQGIARSLAIIEAQGRATGLVGLQKMSQDALQPQAFDSPLKIMGKYAEIRQIVEQNIKTAEASPNISPNQKKLLDDTLVQIKEAIPWTVGDLTPLINGKGSDESVREFANRVISENKGTTAGPPQEAIKELGSNPTPELKRQFDEIFGTGAADRALGKQ